MKRLNRQICNQNFIHLCSQDFEYILHKMTTNKSQKIKTGQGGHWGCFPAFLCPIRTKVSRVILVYDNLGGSSDQYGPFGQCFPKSLNGSLNRRKQNKHAGSSSLVRWYIALMKYH